MESLAELVSVESILVTTFIGLCAILLHRYSVRNYDYFEKKGIPYVKPAPFVGSIFQNIGRPLHETEDIRYKELGPIYGHFEGNRPLISIGDPALLREILVKDFQFFTGRRVISTGDKIFDAMVNVVQGEDWKRIRTIITPTFSTGKIKRMMGIFKDCSKTLIQNFRESSLQRNDVNAKKLYGAFSMDIIASSAFSTKINSHNDPDNIFVRTAMKVNRNINWRFVAYLIAPSLMKLLSVPVFNPTAMRFFSDTTLQIIKERKRTGQTRNDFLQLLMDTAQEVSEEQKCEDNDSSKENDILTNYGDEPNTNHHIFYGVNFGKRNLSMDELVAQCVIFFIAGYDTTASTLSFCSYELALNPHIQEKLREEVDAAIRNHGGEISYEAIQQMKYMDNVLSESLRIHPPAVRLERRADAAYKLGTTGITIPKGMLITIPSYAMHRDPKHFPDPHKFNPDRFNPEEKEKREQYAYLPFGAGPRNCVGMRFALMEIKVCLAHVIANFRIKRSPRTKVPLEYLIGQGLIQPKEILFEIEIRDDSPLKK